jgi:deoxyhypusine synthase
MIRCRFYGKIYYVKKYRPISLKSVNTCSITKRKSKVSQSSFAVPHVKGDKLKTFLDKLPDILAVKNFGAVVKAIVMARQNKRPVILGMGAHPIKVGLSPVIIDLMQKKVITALATNGACIIHDFELSFIGKTSEDVEKELCRGTFGMAQQTGRYINRAIKEGVRKGYGIGMSIGEMIHKSRFSFKKKSIFASAFEIGIPSTVHVAIGTDIIHMHPDADGSAIGEGSFRDFRLFSSVVSDLEGGVYINLGSAVIMPEVFLKALTIARNIGKKVEDITTVNMDFIQHYRPTENVLRRPTIKKGSSYALTGHHEIMFPLLAAAVIEKIG